MPVAERFYEAFTVRDSYTMGLLYAEHATFSDPVFPLLNAKGTRLMWQMLLSRAEEDFAIEVDIVEDSASRARVNWVAHYVFSATKRPVTNRVRTEMKFVAGKIVRQEDTFSLWRWSSQALGAKGTLLGWSPIVRNKIRAQAAASLQDFARKVAKPAEPMPR
ncbi:MAG: nuclear transport factor 2 family protein [Burkholderiaceae bacterium]